MENIEKRKDKDDRYLAEGRDDAKALARTKTRKESRAAQVSWRFFTGLALAFMGLGLGAVPNQPLPDEPNNWLVYVAWNIIQIGACVLFFLEFNRLSAASEKRWKTYSLAALIFLSLAAGVTAGVFLTVYV